MDEDALIVEPKLVGRGQLVSQGLCLLSSLDPSRNELALALGAAEGDRKGKKKAGDDSYIRMIAFEDVPTSRRSLYTSTFTVWTAVQRIAALHHQEHLGALVKPGSRGRRAPSIAAPSPEVVQHHHALAQGYLDAIAQYSKELEDAEFVDLQERHRAAVLHHVFHLAQIVYVPADGRGDSVVGEELLDWVNYVNVAPRSDDLQALKQLGNPFDEDFEGAWDCVNRCLLRGHTDMLLSFLRLLHSHSSPFVSSISRKATSIFAKRPRSTNVADHPTTNAFTEACRRWRHSLAELKRSIEAEDDEWATSFAELVAMAMGDEEKILERCAEYGWLDALGAWVTLVRPAATRDDLPEVIKVVLEAMPIDSTDLIDGMYSALLSGNVPSAVQKCQDYDTWLSTHLTDTFDKLGLIDDDSQSEFEGSLRDYLTLNYADHLRSDPGLWRLSIDYLATCGPVGRARMRPILTSVAFRDSELKEEDEEESVVRDVLDICAVHGLEDVVIAVCKIMSEHLVRQREYGRAIAYCIRSDDARRISRIANALLDEYLGSGAAEFARLVDAIPSSLLHPAASSLRPELFRAAGAAAMDGEEEEEEPAIPTALASRLVVLGRLRDYLGHHARGELRSAAVLLVRLLDSGIAPTRLWPALLVDAIPLLEHPGPRPLVTTEETYELLRCLEQVIGPVATSGKDAAGVLRCLTNRQGVKGGEEERLKAAMQELLAVRQALGRNLARCFGTSAGR